MRFFDVVPEQVLDQLPVDACGLVYIIVKMIEELVSEGPVEPFDIRIGLRMPWIAVEVFNRAVADRDKEMLFELAAVVGLDVSDFERSQLPELFEKISCIEAVKGFVTEGEPKAGAEIDACNQIAVNTISDEVHGIDLNQIARLFRLIVAPPFFLAFLLDLNDRQTAISACDFVT